MKHTTTQFDFVAKPKVTAVKQKYREEIKFDGTNLMNDPRVVRGNTYAAIVETKNDIQPPPLKKNQKEQTKKPARRINFDTGFQVSTPRAKDGRQHFTIQTQPFVETLRDRPIQYQKQCQTDLFLDRPVQRQFDAMKGKTGIDRTTQIEQNDPELFNFDYQVQPIVDALMSKIIQTSRMELYQQNQLKQKQKEKEEYEQKRHARLAEVQKLQANEIRIKEQYDRRQLQYRKSSQQECATHKKVISRILSKQYLKNLKGNTYKILDSQGFFRPPLQTDLLATFSPWLYQQIINQLHQRQQFLKVTEGIINEASSNILSQTGQFIKQERSRRQNIFQQRQSQKLMKQQRREQKRKRKQQEQLARQQALLQQQQNKQQIPPPVS